MRPDYVSILNLDIPWFEFTACLTDLLVSITCFLCFVQLVRKGQTSKVATLFKWHFILMAVATAFGGIAGHALSLVLPAIWKTPGWILSMLSVTLLERAIIEQSRSYFVSKWIKRLLFLNYAELIFFACLAYGTLQFKFVEYHAAYGLLVVILGVGIYKWFKGRIQKHLFLGVLFGIAAALVFTFKWGSNNFLSHVDLSHLVLIGSVYFFYKQSLITS